MEVIVIGGGVAGIATACALHDAGHAVTVVERHATVAQEATFGHGALMLPSALDTVFGPGVEPGAGGLFARSRGPLRLRATGHAPARRFSRALTALADPVRFAERFGMLHALLAASRLAAAEIDARFALDYEQRSGVLHVFDRADRFGAVSAALQLLGRHAVPHRLLGRDELVAVEPALSAHDGDSVGVLLSDERTGNCPLLTKLLRQALESRGVRFVFGTTAGAVLADATEVRVDCAGPGGPLALLGDAAVVAAGTGSVDLLAPLGVKLPWYGVRTHTLTAPFTQEEHALNVAAVIDTERRIWLARLGGRMRLSGAPSIDACRPADGEPDASAAREAFAYIEDTAHRWLPGIARTSAGHQWSGLRLCMPDGLPVIDRVPGTTVFVNAAHGLNGWGLAFGAGKLLVALIDAPADETAAPSGAGLSAGRFFTPD
jgi:D-amino-acid dehydrogenase